MKRISAVIAALVVAFGITGHAAGTSILFIGNSFLFAYGSPVRFYRADTVTDLNNEGIGGVPALFKSFTEQAGLDYDVSISAPKWPIPPPPSAISALRCLDGISPSGRKIIIATRIAPNARSR